MSFERMQEQEGQIQNIFYKIFKRMSSSENQDILKIENESDKKKIKLNEIFNIQYTEESQNKKQDQIQSNEEQNLLIEENYEKSQQIKISQFQLKQYEKIKQNQSFLIRSQQKEQREQVQKVKDISYNQQDQQESYKQSSQSQQNQQINNQPITLQSTSIPFIPFIKSPQEIKQQQDQLIKSYTPVSFCQAFPWTSSSRLQISDSLLRFHNQIIDFYQYIKPSQNQHKLRLLILQQLRKIIQQKYKNAQVNAFGSFASQLYLPDSDIDVVVLINQDQNGQEEQKEQKRKSVDKLQQEKEQENKYNDQFEQVKQNQHQYQDKQQDQQQQNQQKLYNSQQYKKSRQKNLQYYQQIYLHIKRHHKDKFCYIKFIKKARIPLIKLYHRLSKISIDISFNNQSGLLQIPQIHRIKSLYPQFVYLIMIFKTFLRIRNYHQTYQGGIGSFLLCCMVYNYLRAYDNNRYFYTLGELVMKFMAYYFMNYDINKIKIYVKNGKIQQRQRRANTLCMICPFDNKTDIGKKAWKIKEIFEIFKNRYKLVQDKCFQLNQSILKEFINPQCKYFIYYQLKSQQYQDKIKQWIKQIQQQNNLIDNINNINKQTDLNNKNNRQLNETKQQNQINEQSKQQQKQIKQTKLSSQQLTHNQHKHQNKQQQHKQQQLKHQKQQQKQQQSVDYYKRFMQMNSYRQQKKILDDQKKYQYHQMFKVKKYRKLNQKIKSKQENQVKWKQSPQSY